MRISEVARRAGVTTKSVRYYESLGLVTSRRLSNGYRDYDDHQASLVAEVRALSRLGIRLEQTRPFIDCLVAGHASGDDCPDSIATYQHAIDEMTERIGELEARRSALIAALSSANPIDANPTGANSTDANSTGAASTIPRCAFTQEDNHA
ncbi:MAG TPA: MerR family transcriptional regulator [Microbacteriaceae bacterium]|jgi:DNA-binding transcriptional MerR regulator|nr:MerR family transcriptional regulator [Microbacteriaceae bacterium]